MGIDRSLGHAARFTAAATEAGTRSASGAALMQRLTIGELAKLARVNRETVRYYERRRLLPRTPRSVSGYRVFSGDALRRLRFIRHAKELGFSLDEIGELLALGINSPDSCEAVRRRTEAKIADIDRKLAALRQMRRALSELAAACAQRTATGACPVLDFLERNGGFLREKTRGDYDSR